MTKSPKSARTMVELCFHHPVTRFWSHLGLSENRLPWSTLPFHWAIITIPCSYVFHCFPHENCYKLGRRYSPWIDPAFTRPSHCRFFPRTLDLGEVRTPRAREELTKMQSFDDVGMDETFSYMNCGGRKIHIYQIFMIFQHRWWIHRRIDMHSITAMSTKLLH